MLTEYTVAIIGGGFSGMLAAVQLVRQSEYPVKVIVFNAGYPAAKGVAYSTESLVHLLNVPAAKMSAFPHDPVHFRRWLDVQDDVLQFCLPGESLSEAFMPRKIFGNYLAETVVLGQKNLETGAFLEIIHAEITDIAPDAEQYCIILESGEKYKADKVILAFGNFEPGVLRGIPEETASSGLYFNNPWRPEAIENLHPDKPIFLVGTGLTMVDVVLSLEEQNYKGKIYALSTNGRLPSTHKRSNPYPDISNEVQPPYNLNNIYSAVKRHIKIAVETGSNCEALVDSLRPQTQLIWQGLALEDKKRFLRHLCSLWGIFRHRLAPQVAAKMEASRQSGQLQVIAGRLQKATASGNELIVTYKLRGTSETTTVAAQRLVNCTGPQTNYSRIQKPLVKNLLQRELISPDALGLGLAAQPNGKLTDGRGNIIPGFYGIGPVLRGVLWESTAVPEVREQAEKLANTILQELPSEIKTAGVISGYNPLG